MLWLLRGCQIRTKNPDYEIGYLVNLLVVITTGWHIVNWSNKMEITKDLIGVFDIASVSSSFMFDEE